MTSLKGKCYSKSSGGDSMCGLATSLSRGKNGRRNKSERDSLFSFSCFSARETCSKSTPCVDVPLEVDSSLYCNEHFSRLLLSSLNLLRFSSEK